MDLAGIVGKASIIDGKFVEASLIKLI